ncbi:MAG: sugar phosphate nucleotidyltransferase [Candidatus Thermoplasmatota archaeon]|jgi:UTP--glucose-1-phosphate uridylyltransferase|nr:sugar phosphate nucleotidyltransferase [Candidatus Thermoplasmatota archaeon]
MAPVKDALIVAGGLGTRMFPASAMLAKEALPLVDVPLLTHLMEEAVYAGATRIHIISRPGKDLSAWVEGRAELAHLSPHIHHHHLDPSQGVQVLVHEQVEQRGLGDAIACALHAVEGPFLVLLGDNLLMTQHHGPEVLAPSTASRDLVKAYEQTGRPVAGLMRVPPEDASSFGMVAMHDGRITEVVEKPAPGEAPSDLALCGRYLWTEDAAALLDHYDVDAHGELQSIRVQEHWMSDGGLTGVVHEGAVWYDAGRPLPWLKAQIDHALRREDMGEALEAWLASRLQ